MGEVVRAQPLILSTRTAELKAETHGYPFALDSTATRAMVWDPERYGLWIVDGTPSLLFLHLCRSETLLAEIMHHVGALAAFPPGVLPICMAYVGNTSCGRLVRKSNLASFFTAMQAKFSMCVDPASGSVLIAGGAKFILYYDPKTNRCKQRYPKSNSSARWSEIASSGSPGCFLLRYDKGYCRWSLPKCDEGGEAESILFDLSSPYPWIAGSGNRMSISEKRGLYNIGELVHLHKYDFERHTLFRVSCRPLHFPGARCVPLATARVELPGVYVLTTTHLVYVAPNFKDEWEVAAAPLKWMSFSGEPSLYQPFPVSGLCNGVETIFFATNYGHIHTLSLSEAFVPLTHRREHDNIPVTKRRRLEGREHE